MSATMRACDSTWAMVGMVSVSSPRYWAPPTVLSRSRARGLRGQGDHVDGLAPGRQGLDGLEDHPVGGVVEVPRGAHALGHAEGGVVEEDGPEDGPFGVEVVGGHPTVHRGRGRQGGRRVDEGLLGITIPKISLRASHTSLNAWHGSDVGGKFCARFPRRLDPRGELRQGGAGQASWAPFGITTMPVSDTWKPRRRSSSGSKPMDMPGGMVTPLSTMVRRSRE